MKRSTSRNTDLVGEREPRAYTGLALALLLSGSVAGGLWWITAAPEPTDPLTDSRAAIGSRPENGSKPRRQGSDASTRIGITANQNQDPSSQFASARIAGCVKNRGGQPVGHAEVCLTASSETRHERSADDGTFSVQVTSKAGEADLFLTAWAAGYRPTRLPLSAYLKELKSDTSVVKLEIVLEPGATITGRVLFRSEPANKARVDVVTDESAAVPAVPPTWTDSSGRFSVGVSADMTYSMRVSDGVYGLAKMFGVRSTSVAILDVGDIQLVPTSELKFRFVYADREPIRDLLVVLRRVSEGRSISDSAGASTARTRSNESGFVHVWGLAPGRYQVCVPGLMVDKEVRALPIVGTDLQSVDVVVHCQRIRVSWSAARGARGSPTGTFKPRWFEVVQEPARRTFTPEPASLLQRIAPRADRLIARGSTWRIAVGVGKSTVQKIVNATEETNEVFIEMTSEPHRE